MLDLGEQHLRAHVLYVTSPKFSVQGEPPQIPWKELGNFLRAIDKDKLRQTDSEQIGRDGKKIPPTYRLSVLLTDVPFGGRPPLADQLQDLAAHAGLAERFRDGIHVTYSNMRDVPADLTGVKLEYGQDDQGMRIVTNAVRDPSKPTKQVALCSPLLVDALAVLARLCDERAAGIFNPPVKRKEPDPHFDYDSRPTTQARIVGDQVEIIDVPKTVWQPAPLPKGPGDAERDGKLPKPHKKMPAQGKTPKAHVDKLNIDVFVEVKGEEIIYSVSGPGAAELHAMFDYINYGQPSQPGQPERTKDYDHGLSPLGAHGSFTVNRDYLTDSGGYSIPYYAEMNLMNKALGLSVELPPRRTV